MHKIQGNYSEPVAAENVHPSTTGGGGATGGYDMMIRHSNATRAR